MSNKKVAFRFLDEYRESAQRPVLSQSFEDDLSRTYRSKQSVLPAYFANLVPEGQLREMIEDSLGLAHDDELGLLSAVSNDLPGAVEIVSSDTEMELDAGNSYANGEPAYDNGHRETPDSDEPAVELRFSLAGVQLKFSLMREHEKLTLPGSGSRGEVIVKLDSSRFDNVVENEYGTLQWARAAGFDVPSCDVMPSAALPKPLRKYSARSAKVLVIDRYDRVGQRRIHQEDFAQIAGVMPRKKYDGLTYVDCARLARAVLGDAGYREFIARLTFVVASGNADAHLKNWSVVYLDKMTATFAPLYDQVATVAWRDVPFELALKFAETSSFYRVDEALFARLAIRSGGDPDITLAVVHDSLERIAGAWRSERIGSLLPDAHVAALKDYWSRSPLLGRHQRALEGS